MDIEFPAREIGSIRHICVNGHSAFLIRGERKDVVLKVAGQEAVVPEDSDAVVAAVNRLTDQSTA